MLTVLSFSQISPSTSKVSIALLRLDAKGIDPNLSDLISDALLSELNNGGIYDAMERSKVQEILNEQGFQESGACDSESCQVQMGELLGIDQMIVGSIGKFDGTYILNLRRLDIKSAKILASSSNSVEGSLSFVLNSLVPQAIQEVSQSRLSLHLKTPPALNSPIQTNDTPTVQVAPVAEIKHQIPAPVIAQNITESKFTSYHGSYLPLSGGVDNKNILFKDKDKNMLVPVFSIQMGYGYSFWKNVSLFASIGSSIGSDGLGREHESTIILLKSTYALNNIPWVLGAGYSIETAEIEPSNSLAYNENSIIFSITREILVYSRRYLGLTFIAKIGQGGMFLAKDNLIQKDYGETGEMQSTSVGFEASITFD